MADRLSVGVLLLFAIRSDPIDPRLARGRPGKEKVDLGATADLLARKLYVFLFLDCRFLDLIRPDAAWGAARPRTGCIRLH